MSPPPEAEARDRLDRLYRDHARSVYRCAATRLSPQDAEDVVCEVFVVAWRRITEVPPYELGWLLRVTRNVMANHLRAGSRRAALVRRVDTSADRTFTAGDGSATRWVSEKDSAASVAAPMVGVEEVKHADPAGPEGQTTYWWVSPAAGVYTRFTLPAENWDDVREGTIREQLTAQMADLTAQMEAIRALADQPDVVTSGPEERTVGGRAATCFELSGPGSATPASEAPMWVDGAPGSVDWTRAACFDDETHLPLSDERTEHYLLDGATQPSLSVTTSDYTWHPRDDASLALLEPSVAGLREVSQDEFARLTS